VFVKDDGGEYIRISMVLELDEEIEKELEPFKKISERVPLHKKLGEQELNNHISSLLDNI